MIIHCYFGIPLSGPATADKVLVLDHLSLLYTRFVTIVTITKLSKQTSSCSWIILLNSPGGSILQWVDRQGLLCVASVVFLCTLPLRSLIDHVVRIKSSVHPGR